MSLVRSNTSIPVELLSTLSALTVGDHPALAVGSALVLHRVLTVHHRFPTISGYRAYLGLPDSVDGAAKTDAAILIKQRASTAAGPHSVHLNDPASISAALSSLSAGSQPSALARLAASTGICSLIPTISQFIPDSHSLPLSLFQWHNKINRGNKRCISIIQSPAVRSRTCWSPAMRNRYVGIIISLSHDQYGFHVRPLLHYP